MFRMHLPPVMFTECLHDVSLRMSVRERSGVPAMVEYTGARVIADKNV